MKYLIYSKTNKQLSNLILKQENIKVIKLGLHTTLCFFEMNPIYQSQLINSLKAIKFQKIKTKTQTYQKFEQGAFVIKLELTQDLLTLHKNIIQQIEKYAKEELKPLLKYYNDNYKPHITISRHDLNFDTNNKTLLNQPDQIKEFILAKKTPQGWEDIAKYKAK